MTYTNIIEKLNCIINIVKDNWFYLAFLGFIAILLILVNIKIISRKTCFITSLISYITLLSYTIITYSKELSKIGNSIMDNLFMSIYFPSAYVYLFTLIVIDIVTFVSLMNNKKSKIYKWIHGIFFFIIQFTLILILEILSKNKIDIFSKTSLFSDKNLIMLLEFSINAFITWIITLIFVYFTNLITEKIKLSSVTKEEKLETLAVNMNTLVATIDLTPNEKEQPETKPVFETISQENNNIIETTVNIENNNSLINDINERTQEEKQNIIETVTAKQPEKNNFFLNDFIPNQTETIIPEPILTEEKTNIKEEVIEENPETANYTLNDYRLFNKMLKEIKEHNQNNNVTIDKNLEYRLITKYSPETYNMFKKMLEIYSH